jgi:hypothetical protein
MMKTALSFLFAICSLCCTAQVFNATLQHEIPSDCKNITMTMQHDNNGKDFLYVAAKDGGLRIYDVSSTPKLVKTILTKDLKSLHVCNLSQSGNYLYLALGNSFAKAKQYPGVAIIDVTNPATATVSAVWSDTKKKSGSGIVRCVGNYIYLAAMSEGLIVLDATDKKNPKKVAQLVPDINYPDAKADPAKVNARGMDIAGNTLYLCYDAGGLRIIDITNPLQPIETGKYANPVMNGKPRAYNNVVVDSIYAFVAVDYCGMEILNIADPKNITLINWWNPWNCQESAMNWFKSDGHANEIAYDKKNKLIFLSTGKSDLNVVSVQDVKAAKQVFVYGGPSNNQGTWGVSIYEDKIYLSYICAFVPFSSNWTGVKILTYSTTKQ